MSRLHQPVECRAAIRQDGYAHQTIGQAVRRDLAAPHTRPRSGIRQVGRGLKHKAAGGGRPEEVELSIPGQRGAQRWQPDSIQCCHRRATDRSGYTRGVEQSPGFILLSGQLVII